MNIKFPELPDPQELKGQKSFNFYYNASDFWCTVDIEISENCTRGLVVNQVVPLVDIKYDIGTSDKPIVQLYKTLVKDMRTAYKEWIYQNILEGYGLASVVL